MSFIYRCKIIDKYILKANNYHNDSLVSIYKRIFKQKKIMKLIFKSVPEFYKIYVEHYILNENFFKDCHINESIVRCWKIYLEKQLISHI